MNSNSNVEVDRLFAGPRIGLLERMGLGNCNFQRAAYTQITAAEGRLKSAMLRCGGGHLGQLGYGL